MSNEIKKQVYADYGITNCPEVIFEHPKKVTVIEVDGTVNTLKNVYSLLVVIPPSFVASKMSTSFEFCYKTEEGEGEFIIACKFVKEIKVEDMEENATSGVDIIKEK